ncbi:unnamed protein product, partial [Adineta steineri]
MLKIILILFIGLINLPKTTPCASQWSQCGGIGYSGDTNCCDPTTTCQYSNPWYSQCLTGPTNPTTTTIATTTTSNPANSGCASVYSQCGGQNWQGPACCIASTCNQLNPYYSQCQPGTTSPPTASSTDSTTISSTTQSTASTTLPPTTTISTTVSTSSSSSSTSSINQACSSMYQQCGGITWNGLTTCCSGSVCTCLNDYYWQCLPPGQSSSCSSSSNNNPSSTAASSSSSSS